MLRPLVLLSVLFVFTVASGCSRNDEPGDEDDAPAGNANIVVSPDSQMADEQDVRELITVARVAIEPLGGSDVSGSVTFARSLQGVRLTYNIVGLGSGRHGFHVHETGSCEDGDDGTPGGAAGGHFNPAGAPHGAPDGAATARHAGDLGNLYVLPHGSAAGTFTDPLAELDGENSIIGRALMIHAGEDDFATQPTGNAGARIGCGVITGVEV